MIGHKLLKFWLYLSSQIPKLQAKFKVWLIDIIHAKVYVPEVLYTLYRAMLISSIRGSQACTVCKELLYQVDVSSKLEQSCLCLFYLACWLLLGWTCENPQPCLINPKVTMMLRCSYKEIAKTTEYSLLYLLFLYNSLLFTN